MKTRKIRERIAGCSTSNGNYFETKGHIVQAVESALKEFDYHLGDVDMPNDNGTGIFEIYEDMPDGRAIAGFVNVSWYRMPSGRYELTCYIT